MPSNKPRRKPIKCLYSIRRGDVDQQWKIDSLEVLSLSQRNESQVVECRYVGDSSSTWVHRFNLYDTFDEAKAAIINLQYDEIRKAQERLRVEIGKLDKIMEYREGE